jgi:DnaJ-class molecular chaperone
MGLFYPYPTDEFWYVHPCYTSLFSANDWFAVVFLQDASKKPGDNNVYYDVLGVTRIASADAIKTSYLSKKSRYSGTDAKKKLALIEAAYSTLNSSRSREAYDRHGVDPDSVDLKGASLRFDLNLSLELLYCGCTKKLSVKHNVLADDGLHTRLDKTILEIPVPAGWKDGEEIIIAGQGDEEPEGTAGDCIITVREKKHERFQRRGEHLMTTVQVDLAEAVMGARFTLNHLSGKTLLVECDKSRALNGTVTHLKIANQGMPVHESNPLRYGDLFVTVTIAYPPPFSIPSALKEKLEIYLPSGAESFISNQPVGSPIQKEEMTTWEMQQAGKMDVHDEIEERDGVHQSEKKERPHPQCAQQ